ncbi:hypothetical protein GH714_028329 [Hevea brasiliensis]|uniref:Zinc knuckle CX2CX3GHX4C domain-containing protein n=1 Tax=Hevea brasiliensis TaxID=3981 RepID=A0A6A6LVX1_HEVBR|nr:hypothetical protein GH714_028329 [Hevea brasiliensis]
MDGHSFGGFRKKTPREGYICHRCKVPGHFIQYCPTNGDPNYNFKRVRPPTGIPKSMLVPNADGFYVCQVVKLLFCSLMMMLLGKKFLVASLQRDPGSFQESKKTTLYNIEDEANKRKLLDDPYQIAKKARTTRAADVSEATIGSTRMKDTASQGSVLVVEEDVQQEVVSSDGGKNRNVAEDEVQQKLVFSKGGKEKERNKNSEDDSQLLMPVGSYAYNPYWAGVQDTAGSYTSLNLRLANEIIGTRAQKVVLKAKHGDSGSRYLGKVDLSHIGELHVTGSPASYYSAIHRLHSANRWQ